MNKKTKQGFNKTTTILIMLLFVTIFLLKLSFSECMSVQPINTFCTETVKLTSECDYVNLFDSNDNFYDTVSLIYINDNWNYTYDLNITNTGIYNLRFCDGVTFADIRITDNGTVVDNFPLSEYSGVNAEIQNIDENIDGGRLMVLAIFIFIWLGTAFIGLRFRQTAFLIISGLIGIISGILMFSWLYWWVGLVFILLNIVFMFFSFKNR